MTLQPDDFAAFFHEVHGCAPFPWQQRLLKTLADAGTWPRTLDLPTGSGKTAAIDIAVFHLALEVEKGPARRAALRIAFVVDRRLVVDDAQQRALRLAAALRDPSGPTVERVAQRLRSLAVDGPPLIVRALRGGLPREDDWARSPSQPTVVCSTVDQVGSRLLFRGYGVSDSMKPIHAGLLGSDCLLLLDEAHLAEPFRQTLDTLGRYHSATWCEPGAAPWSVALLTATPAERESPFGLLEDDFADKILAARLNAAKPALLVEGPKPRAAEPEQTSRGDTHADLEVRTALLVREVDAALRHFRDGRGGVAVPALGVIVNRVQRARAVLSRIRSEFVEQIAAGTLNPLLLIGPARPVDRALLVDHLSSVRTGAPRDAEHVTIIIATQCLEVGVDIDLDGLITEAAPIDALRQRFGRLNRAGRDIQPYATIVAVPSELSARYTDPVYGNSIREAWAYLKEHAAAGEQGSLVDFGSRIFQQTHGTVPAATLAPRPDAPVLMPAHVDLFSQTAPVSTIAPEVSLYLHGTDREGDSVQVTWRADVEREGQNTLRLLTLVPPRAAESIQLPLWEVKRWLTGDRREQDSLADVPGALADDDDAGRRTRQWRNAYRWKGPEDEGSGWISPAELRPGDSLVVPANYGGADAFGWDRGAEAPVRDRGIEAAAPYASRQFHVRVSPGLIRDRLQDEGLERDTLERRSEALAERLAAVLATCVGASSRELILELDRLDLPLGIRSELGRLAAPRAGRLQHHLDVYGTDDRGRPRGVVLVAPLGLAAGTSGSSAHAAATEDDLAGSITGNPIPLATHHADVAALATAYAAAAGLSQERIRDLDTAARLHDLGKADARFQAWLWYGDPVGPDTNSPHQLLAKSGRPLPRTARAAAGLPPHWRHESSSVARAMEHDALAEGVDTELVLWLIGTHHGYGRPLFPHSDPDIATDRPGPHSLAFSWKGMDWPSLYEHLKAKYGTWELARFEAFLRLADHRASARAAGEDSHA